jgi:WD40 repeat protein
MFLNRGSAIKRRHIGNIGCFLIAALALAAVWVASRPRTLIVSRSLGTPATSIAFSPGDSRIASGGWGRELTIFHGNSLEFRSIVTGFNNVVQPITFSPDGKLIAVGDSSDSIHLIDAVTGSRLRSFKCHLDELRCVAWSPDGTLLATAGRDKVTIIWDLRTGKPIHKLWGQGLWTGRIAFTPDGKTLATAGSNNIHLWDVQSGKLLREIPSSRLCLPFFSLDGKFCVGGGLQDTTVVWNTPDWTVAHQFTDKGVLGVDVSNDYKIVIATKGELRIHDLTSGKLMRTITVSEQSCRWPTWLLRAFPNLRPGPVSRIECVAINRDGSMVAASMLDGTIHTFTTR